MESREEQAPPDSVRNRRVRKIFALLREAHLEDRRERLNLFSWITHNYVSSTNDLSERELELVCQMLEYWQRNGELESQARSHTDWPWRAD